MRERLDGLLLGGRIADAAGGGLLGEPLSETGRQAGGDAPEDELDVLVTGAGEDLRRQGRQGRQDARPSRTPTPDS